MTRHGRLSGRSTSLLTVVAVVAVVAVLLSGCTNSGGDARSIETTPVVDEPSGGELVFGVSEDASGWNPIVDAWSRPAMQIARSIFEPLMTYDSDNHLQPELVESIESNDTFTEWTMTVRPDISFQDGSALDAATVRANLEARMTSPLTGPWFESLKSVQVAGPRTVRVLMDRPWSTFPHLLAGQAGFMVSSAMLGDPSASQRPVGTGPFELASWEPGTSVTVRRFEGYRRSGIPRLDRIVFRVVPDPVPRSDLLISGELDVAMTDDPDQITRLAEQPARSPLQVTVDGEGEAPKLFVAFNSATAPFIDFDARRAVVLATDRRALGVAATGSDQDIVKGPVSPTSPWFEDLVTPDRDLAQARQLAADHEKRYGRPLSFELLVSSDPVDLGAAALWQHQLAEAGIVVELVWTRAEDMDLAARTGRFDAVMMHGFGSWHPDQWYPLIHQAQMTPVGVAGPNIARFGTEAIDGSLDDARSMDDLALQVEDYRKVQEELVGGMAYLFVMRMPEALASRSDVRDLTSWTTSSGAPGLGIDAGAVALGQVWVDRESPRDR